MIGKTVSHYSISEELGRGGMGVVYRARDERLRRDVALKFLPSDLTSDAGARERFIREARAASSLDHQNICTIYDVGESDDGQTYIVMAYYEGRTLKARIDDGPLSIEDAVSISVQIADGLAAAHRKGIVHRDIKPGNVIVTPDGVAKILDFGLAKLAGTKVELTAQDSTLGTAAYMSPEQARGDEIDARTDLWSLGVIVFEMLTGKRPFAADYEQALLYGILNEVPARVDTLRPEVPVDVADVVQRALSRDTQDRYASAEELSSDLRSGSVPLGSAVGMPSQRSRAHTVPAKKSRVPVIGLVAAVLIVLAVLAFWIVSGWSDSDERVERSVIAVMPFTVQGDPELQYLETGMVDLLSRKLDGAASLRGVDPNALLGRLGDDVKGVRDPSEARAVATSFGAGRFILGSITKIGSSIQFNASLYDTDGALQTEAETSAESDDQLMSSIDRLAQLLIADQLGAAGQTLDQTAATTTESLPALKAFLEGERALAEGRSDEALGSMREAVELDSTFGLAWYRLRDALGWNGIISGPERDRALAMAIRYRDRLPVLARRMIDAEKAFDEARFDDARGIYEDVIRQQPDNVSALLKMGDLIYHYGDREGYPSVRAREYFERALSLNPENQEGQGHLISIAAKERDSVAVRNLLQRFRRDGADNPLLNISDRIAAGERAEGSFFAEIRSLAKKAPNAPFVAGGTSALLLEDMKEARRWIAIADESEIPEVRNQAAGFRAFTLATEGKLRQMKTLVEKIQSEDANEGNGGIASFFLMLALTPYSNADAAELDSLRDRLTRADLTARGSSPLPSTLRSQAEVYRQYVVGLVSYRMGDQADLERRIARLRDFEPPDEGPDLAQHAASVLTGLQEWKAGRRDAALASLRKGHLPLNWNLGNNAIIDESFNRWVIGEILYESGRLEEALPYYQSLVGTSNFLGFLYLGPSYLRRAQVYEQLGDDTKAIDYYQRLIDLWQDGDPEVQSYVEQAREGLGRVLDRSVREPG